MSENPVSNFKDFRVGPVLTPQFVKSRLSCAIQSSTKPDILNTSIFSIQKGRGYKSKEILNNQTNIGKITINAFDLMSYTSLELEELGRIKSPIQEIYNHVNLFLLKTGELNTKGEFFGFDEHNLIRKIFRRKFGKRRDSKEVKEYKQISLDQKLMTISNYINYLSKVFEKTTLDQMDYTRIKAQNSFSKLKDALELSRLLYTDNPLETANFLNNFVK